MRYKTCMSDHDPTLLDQSRWNTDYGTNFLKQFEADPNSFPVGEASLDGARKMLLESLPSTKGRILDFGCGQGEFSIALAMLGADVTGIDIGEDLVELSQRIADHNHVPCKFVAGSITELPFEDGEFDLVVGVGILHHLPIEATALSLAEAHRVLKPGGSACFLEPLENSEIFDALQSLIPVGKPEDSQYRPSILQRARWAEFQRTLDERQLTDRELETLAEQYSSLTRTYHGLLSRLTRIIPGDRAARLLDRVDEILTKPQSPLKRYSRQVLFHLVK